MVLTYEIDQEKFKRGKAFFEAAASALSDYSRVDVEDLKAGIYYAEMQMWLPSRDKRNLRFMKLEIEGRKK